jgi:arylamine N-acetyltransferase
VDQFDLDTFLERLGLERHDVALDLAGLARLQHASLAAIPLHDLHVRDGSQPGIHADEMARHAQAGSGNWRFGANAALATVLRAVGFHVAISGAALLLDGPNGRIDHIVLEVSARDLDPHLVDVGLARAPTQPVRLNRSDVQTCGRGEYQLLPSPQGTTLATIDDGVPVALLRFRRVAHELEDFAAIIGVERDRHRNRGDHHRSVTRLIAADTFDRVVLTEHRIELHRPDAVTVDDIRGDDEWNTALHRWFPTLLGDGGVEHHPPSGTRSESASPTVARSGPASELR